MSTPTTMTPDMTTPTVTTRDTIIWRTLLEWLHDRDKEEDQLAALRVMVALEPEDLPIEAIVTELLAQTDETDSTLRLAGEDDVWSTGLKLIESAPNRVPLELVIAALRLACEQENDTEILLDLVEKLKGIDHPEPFIALLTDDEPVIRQVGLEAMYRLSLSAPILPLLTDPDPDTRALAVENACVLKALTLDELQAFIQADQPQEVRDRAQSYIDSAAKALALALAQQEA